MSALLDIEALEYWMDRTGGRAVGRAASGRSGAQAGARRAGGAFFHIDL